MKSLLILIAAITLTGCVRPVDHPVNPDCLWSEDGSRPLDLTKLSDRRHLRFDALTAEDMAIRWADQRFSHLREYDERCGECREKLFQGVAEHHGVEVAIVRQYSMDRDVLVNAPVILSFGIFYILAAYILTGHRNRRISNG